MKVYTRRFNLYLAFVMMLAVLCGCQSEKTKANNAKKKVVAALRIHIQADPSVAGTTDTISVLRSAPVSVAVGHDPVLTEANIISAEVIETPGGFAIEVHFDETGTLMLEQYSAANPGRHFVIFGQWGDKLSNGAGWPRRSSRAAFPTAYWHSPPTSSREEADQLVQGAQQCFRQNSQGHVQDMKFYPGHRTVITAGGLFFIFCANLFAQSPFQFPTANHALYQPDGELKFFAPTSPRQTVDEWKASAAYAPTNTARACMRVSTSFTCKPSRRGEPTDPVMATADGAVVYFSKKSGLSNYGNYIVIRHFIDGLVIYSLYAHLSEIQSGLKIGDPVKAGGVIGTMGRTSSAEPIAKDRAHVHFELDLLVNDNFATWFKKVSTPGERNDHGEWNGQNLNGLDPREILLAERNGKFSLLNFVRSQTELCRVLVRATNFPYLKRYAALVLMNPVAEKEGVAGYEIALNYNGVAFALLPRAASEIKGSAKIQQLSVNEAVQKANPCRKLVVSAATSGS
ncbi:MAG: M23 family metallopeptidase [Limisphaerales bacterium]